MQKCLFLSLILSFVFLSLSPPFRWSGWLGLWAPLVINCILAQDGVKRVAAFQEAQQVKNSSSFLVLGFSFFFSFVQRRRYRQSGFVWLVDGRLLGDPALWPHHVIRQQLMQRGPSRLFSAPFFLGVRMAMMASSNTVFRPFWVSAEHST